MSTALPTLREELDISVGPQLQDGQPSWTLHDPSRHRFYRIDWMSFEILSRWSLGNPQMIANSVRAETTLRIDDSHVHQVLEFLQQNQLVAVPHPGQSREMASLVLRQKDSWWTTFLHHYLFFRIPLWRPDMWLTRWMPVARLFFSHYFMAATGLALLFGLIMIFRESDIFLHTFFETFSLGGLVSYGITLIFIKLMHELGHAFAAKRHGCRVPVMGVAFVLLWPMAYTDTNESWRIADSIKRLQVASAGMLTELTVAAWATLAWPFLPEGELKMAVFFLATTSWVVTLAVNLSPFMRFDGYFVLSDWLDIPNLHERSFALARWRLRETLFAVGDPPPETFDARRQRWLIVFAWTTWIYRLVVFFGIALLVYQFFFKLLGIVLFLVEIGWFIARPVAKEMLAWRELLPRAFKRQTGRWRFGLVSVALVILIGLLFIPQPYRVVVAGVAHPSEYLVIRPPAGAMLASVDVRAGQMVARDQALIRLEQPDLYATRHLAKVREETLRWQAANAGLNAASRARLMTHESEWVKAAIDENMVIGQIDRLQLRAPFAGIVVDIAPDLHPGQWLPAREPIGLLVNPAAGHVAETYVDETMLKVLKVGDKAMFIDPEGKSYDMSITQIDRDAARQLSSGLFATVAGGPVSARVKDGVLFPERSVYRILLKLDPDGSSSDPALHRFTCGTVSMKVGDVRYGWHYLERFLSVFRREAGV